MIAIVGPTASGKTSLALKIAERYSGEIICADSRTIYKGMDIGTAKPTAKERRGVAHHCLDIIEPNQSYSAAQFKRDAQESIAEIRGRGHLPIMAGGTGLYTYGVIYDYVFPAGPDNELRRELSSMGIDKLRQRLRNADKKAYESIDINNPRRLIRAIETAGVAKSKQSQLPANVLLVGLFPGLDALQPNIKKRTKEMIGQGLEREVMGLVKQFGANLEPFRSIGYQEIIDYINGQNTIEEAEQLINLHSLQLAKRQMAWYKRNREIQWFNDPEVSLDFVGQWLHGNAQ